MKRPLPPCIDCDKRSEGCHGRCEGYQEYKRLNEAYKSEYAEVKRKIHDMDAYRSSKRKRGQK